MHIGSTSSPSWYLISNHKYIFDSCFLSSCWYDRTFPLRIASSPRLYHVLSEHYHQFSIKNCPSSSSSVSSLIKNCPSSSCFLASIDSLTTFCIDRYSRTFRSIDTSTISIVTSRPTTTIDDGQTIHVSDSDLI